MPKDTIQAVVFDLDGTLLDSLQDIADAMNGALTALGMDPYPVDAYRTMVGDGVVTLARRAAAKQPHQWEALRRGYQARYETHNRVRTAPYPGIVEMLNALQQQGLPLAVFSNKPDQDTKAVVRHYFPHMPFQVVRGQLSDVPVKPDPTGALAVAAEMGIDPDHFLYLGDTSTDMICARQAGMHPVGVLWGFRQRQELEDAGAEAIIARPMEVLEVIRRMNEAPMIDG